MIISLLNDKPKPVPSPVGLVCCPPRIFADCLACLAVRLVQTNTKLMEVKFEKKSTTTFRFTGKLLSAKWWKNQCPDPLVTMTITYGNLNVNFGFTWFEAQRNDVFSANANRGISYCSL